MDILFQCVQDGKFSKEQAEMILNQRLFSNASASFVHKAAIFSTWLKTPMVQPWW